MRALILFTALALVCAAPRAEEQPVDRAAADVLPEDLASGPMHRVLDPVRSDGYLDIYTVRSDFGEFTAIGRQELRTRIAELQALQQLQDVSKSKVFLESAADAGVNMAQGIASAVKDPRAALDSLPSGVGRLFSRTKRTVERGVDEVTVRATEQDRASAQALFDRNGGVSDAERAWSKELEVNPYSNNLTLRDAISSVARVDSAAGFAVSFVAPTIISLGSDLLVELSDEVWASTPEQLEENNRERLRKSGFTARELDNFFDTIWYIPSWRTGVAAAIESMADVGHVDRVVPALLSVESSAEAFFVTQTLVMLAAYHRNRVPLAHFAPDDRVPHAVDDEGRHTLLLPTDHVFATAQVSGALSRLREQVEADMRLLVLKGSLSPQARTRLQAADWQVEEGSDLGALAAE